MTSPCSVAITIVANVGVGVHQDGIPRHLTPLAPTALFKEQEDTASFFVDDELFLSVYFLPLVVRHTAVDIEVRRNNVIYPELVIPSSCSMLKAL